MPTKKWLWEPTRDFLEKTNVHGFMKRLGFEDRESFLQFSHENLEIFWNAMVKEADIEWFQPYERILDTSRGVEWARWFVNGKVNITWNCLDRYAQGPSRARVACLWEGEDGAMRAIAFSELYAEVSRLAHALQALGLREGDRVAVYMPMVPEVITIIYACLKIGLIVVPIFSGFGPGPTATRVEDSGARIIFTADFAQRRGKLIPLKEKADQALGKASAVEKVIVFRYKGGSVPWHPRRDIRWHELLQNQPEDYRSAALDSEHRAFILYTSGTTGKTKGTVHTHAGSLAQMSKEICLGFDHQAEDRFFWLTDIGWMMGPWEIIGNHNFGGNIFVYDGAPDYPQADRLWDILERYRITTFGISPTAIRLLMRKGPELVGKHDLSSLRLLGSTGEPWDETSYRWFFENVGGGRCPIINISGGTEIVGCFLFPLPIQPLKPCALGAPAPGMATEVFDENDRSVRGQTGYLVCTKPAPSMTRGLWNDDQRYLESYWSRWPGVWFHGDWASVDEDGCWYLHGRADETFNVAGRKVGPAEVEQALIEHPSVSEAAVIGVPDELTGESIVAFVVPKAGTEIPAGRLDEIAAHVAQSMGPTFRPKAIHAVEELPKTQSGKIVRQAIRPAYLGNEITDLSTVDNPQALKSFWSRKSR